MNKPESGLSIIETVLIVATIAVIVFVGFAIYQADQDSVNTQNPSSQDMFDPEGGQASGAETIESENDLEEAADTLEDINFDEAFEGESELEDDSGS